MAIFAFLDEAGDFVFSPKASNFLVFAGIISRDPLLFAGDLQRKRYELHTQGNPLEKFHACEDLQSVRNGVFQILQSSRDYTIHAVVVRKNRVNKSLYRYGIYSLAYKTLLKYLTGSGRIQELHVVVDSVPDRSQQAALKTALENRAREILAPRRIRYSICHHSSASHSLLQAVDYCAWAIYKKWHAADTRSYDLIRARVANEFDVFQKGDMDYY